MRSVLILLSFLSLALPNSAAHADGIGDGDFDGELSEPPTSPWATQGLVLISPDENDPGSNSQVAELGPDPDRRAVALSQGFNCGEGGSEGVCSATFWVQWLPNPQDPGGDERLEIVDVGDRTTVSMWTFDEPLTTWTPVTVSLGACGPQQISIEIRDPDLEKENRVDSQARVDSFSCTCEQPVPTLPTTWGSIKTRFE